MLACAGVFGAVATSEAQTGPTSFVLRGPNSLVCAGLIVHERNGVVPANCVDGRPVSGLEATAADGTIHAQIRTVTQYVVHPSYETNQPGYNVATVVFSAPLMLSEHVQIGLPSSFPLFSPYTQWIENNIFVEPIPQLICP